MQKMLCNLIQKEITSDSGEMHTQCWWFGCFVFWFASEILN